MAKKKSIWTRIQEADLGEPAVLITQIDHFKGDTSKKSYTAVLVEDKEEVECINKRSLGATVRAVEKKLVSKSAKKKTAAAKLKSHAKSSILEPYAGSGSSSSLHRKADRKVTSSRTRRKRAR